MDDLKQLKPSASSPWADEKYFETVIDNDPALQFGRTDSRVRPMVITLVVDIEEDLNQLGQLTVTENRSKDDPLTAAHDRIRQLEEMVGTLK